MFGCTFATMRFCVRSPLMRQPIQFYAFALVAAAAMLVVDAQACSMYKLTVDGKTMVGCNHDDWWVTPKIWFINAKQAGHHGAAFTGAREMSGNRTAPQSGMNTAGLVFSRLASIHPVQETDASNRLKISDEVDYLTELLQSCATVAEVKAFVERYDHSYFINGVFIYIDQSGDYLIVEPYRLIEGNDPTYVLANFCPSITSRDQARSQVRYRNGEDFLATHRPTASLDYCTALSDSMHVARKRNNDGTLLTSIWDAQEGSVNLFFYHDYTVPVRFTIADELAKGDHVLNVAEIFPANAGFMRLMNYKTPSNTPELRTALAALAFLLLVFSGAWVLALFWRRKAQSVSLVARLGMVILNLLVVGHTVVLLTQRGVFYFDAPYTVPGDPVISASSYIPFVLALASVPLFVYLKRRASALKPVTRLLVLTNGAVYAIAIAAYGYWGLYSVWL